MEPLRLCARVWAHTICVPESGKYEQPRETTLEESETIKTNAHHISIASHNAHARSAQQHSSDTRNLHRARTVLSSVRPLEL